MATRRHTDLIEAASRWAQDDKRVRALLLKGSIARGEEHEDSDVDFVVVAHQGELDGLWADRLAVAEGLGDWLGGFEEVAWQAPHTYIGFYDGPVKVDFFYKEGEPDPDPWLRDGFSELVDPDGVAAALRTRLAAEPPAPLDLAYFDPHAWDWLWAMDVKLTRGQNWLVYVELVKFVETMLLDGFNELSGQPWRSTDWVERRLPEAEVAELRAALPASPDPADLRPALDEAFAAYGRLRRRLAGERGMQLAEPLARQVLGTLGR